MRRFALLLLLCVLSLQFSLTAAVDARLHADARHHHDASHSTESAAAAAPDTASADESLSRLYGECGACHCCHFAAMLDTRAALKRPAAAARIDLNGGDAHPRSAATVRPERPNWLSLV